jgi:hypothetical protein
MRRAGWIDEAPLLPGERILRSGDARLRTPGPPGWWRGTLVLTTDRIFFVADTESALTPGFARWLADTRASARGDALVLATGQPPPVSLRIEGWGVPGRRARAWAAAVAAARPGARPEGSFRRPARRRAG